MKFLTFKININNIKNNVILICANRGKIRRIKFIEKNISFSSKDALLMKLKRYLIDYFNKKRVDFSKVQFPIYLPFNKLQKKVLNLIREIPYGETRTYKYIASKCGIPPILVGRFLKYNPLPIIIPCHRVIKSDGSLGGYAFGKKWKKILLNIENSTGESSSGRTQDSGSCRRGSSPLSPAIK